MSGNGTGYEGDRSIFADFHVAKPCSVVDAKGAPLPNQEIAWDSAGYQLIRTQCSDILPRSLNSNDVTVIDSQHLMYQGLIFQAFTPDAYYIAAASCPPDMTAIAGATRTNLVLDPVNLVSSNWGVDGDVSATPFGSFDGLPAFAITRTAPNTQDWERWDQWVDLAAGHRYALSFMARAGSATHARLTLFDNSVADIDSGGVWDLTTGQVISNFNSGLGSPSLVSRSVPGTGYFLTYYFTAPNPVRGVDFGFSSDEAATAGESISVTAVQLEDLSTFCR